MGKLEPGGNNACTVVGNTVPRPTYRWYFIWHDSSLACSIALSGIQGALDLRQIACIRPGKDNAKTVLGSSKRQILRTIRTGKILCLLTYKCFSVYQKSGRSNRYSDFFVYAMSRCVLGRVRTILTRSI